MNTPDGQPAADLNRGSTEFGDAQTPDEAIFDCLLIEALGGQRPPDQRRTIIQRLDDVASPVVAGRQSTKVAPKEGSKGSRQSWSFAIGIAAAALLAIGIAMGVRARGLRAVGVPTEAKVKPPGFSGTSGPGMNDSGFSGSGESSQSPTAVPGGKEPSGPQGGQGSSGEKRELKGIRLAGPSGDGQPRPRLSDDQPKSGRGQSDTPATTDRSGSHAG